MIQTEIWNPVSDKPGKVQYAGQRKIGDVFKELYSYLKAEDILPDEYFLLNNHLNEDDDFPQSDVQCYAQWGSNEGIYLEVDLIVYDEEHKARQIHFATGKTLSETVTAYDRMQYIAGQIYKAFCGERFVPSRYMILSSSKTEKITYDMLIGKLESECAAFMRGELLHKQIALSEISQKLGMMLTILSVIKNPNVYVDLPADNVEELYSNENILDRLCEMCSSVNNADVFEIGDIIASAPTFLEEENIKQEKEPELSEDIYYGFTHFSRMSFSNIPHSDFEDEITFGLYVRNDGCISEASVRWELLDGKLVPAFRIFEDGIKAAFSSKFLAVVDKLRYMGDFTPVQLAELLITQGFEDHSNEPLSPMSKEECIRLSKDEIAKYERLMNLPSDHKELEDFPEYALIQKWTARFDVPGYEMDIKICSSGYAQPLWSEAVLFYNGKQLSCSEPGSELKGEWTLHGNNMEFTVFVEEEDINKTRGEMS